MAVTDAPTHADLGDLKREVRSGVGSLSTKLVELEDTMVKRFDKVERDLGAIKRHLGVPDDA